MSASPSTSERPWAGEIPLPEPVARAAIERAFPDLAPARLQALPAGWDHHIWRVNGDWVFRFPRRHVAIPLLAAEREVLPAIAARLPLPVPMIGRWGPAHGQVVTPFAGCRYLPGTTACRAVVSEAVRTSWAQPLARFLRTLHDLPAPTATPGDTLRRSDLCARIPWLARRLAALRTTTGDGRVAVAQAWVGCLDPAALPEGPAVLVHGDLYPRHVLVRDDGTLGGVIDWGDVHRGDRALDLSIAFTLLGPEARGVFRDAYGGVDDVTWERARFRAVFYGAILVAYGRDTGDRAIEAVGWQGLQACTASPDAP